MILNIHIAVAVDTQGIQDVIACSRGFLGVWIRLVERRQGRCAPYGLFLCDLDNGVKEQYWRSVLFRTGHIRDYR